MKYSNLAPLFAAYTNDQLLNSIVVKCLLQLQVLGVACSNVQDTSYSVTLTVGHWAGIINDPF